MAVAFEQAALAMTAIVTEAAVAAREPVRIACVAPDQDVLLVDWLNQLVFEMATRQMLFGRFEVAIDRDDDWRLTATAWAAGRAGAASAGGRGQGGDVLPN